MHNQENREVALRLSGVKKKYKLGQIGGGTLTADLQSWWARVRGKEDPNAMIGTDQRLIGQTFMALNGIDLTVYKGEALGIIGGNGAGKSTMLKLLCRVTAPTEGEIDLYGRIASMLEVGTGFNGEMTGRENIYMNGAILGMTKAEIDAKMEDIIEFSEVRDFIDTPVKRYSSGMFVKLAFSVAAHLDSEIMIMDEVLAVGDMAFQKKCLTKMRAAAKEEGRTVLYVSHNMNTIRQLCDRCIVLDKGRIVFNGDVEKAIALYLNMGVQEQAVHVDLSNKRMSHLPEDLVVKMLHIHLEGKEDACYEMNELLPFTLTVRAHKRIRELCMRLEIRTESAEPCGTTLLNNFASMEAGQITDYRFAADLRGLIPGNYVGLLVLYEVTESGEFNDLDAVLPAFCFEVRDVLGRQGIHWVPAAWGYMQFPDMTMRDENETENCAH